MISGTAYVGYDGGPIEQKILKLAGRGLEAATIHLLNRVRTTLSEPAERKRNKLGRYRATTKATPGAPPRKLSGDLRRSQNYQMLRMKTIGRVGTTLLYGKPLETWMDHSFLGYTLEKSMGELRIIMQGNWNSTATQISFNTK